LLGGTKSVRRRAKFRHRILWVCGRSRCT